ncbi:ABC-type Fe3+-siderophore transport system permease subunit [Neorhizobium huautlense]|uniref:ABC-type Fe3+-siderophore transport system permease subunit n=1 Tax=Neorhizobium huautlense TaxID=67774 RepID=A0ABT9PWB2_9HYPH|nr:hypothetical protein [Neorhizobium huautlense]MDP9838766.1 ABC-type Fe3+-siderophore transport system permease subunit [Neorhizobium huautlense]
MIDQPPVDDASLGTYVRQPPADDAEPQLSKRSKPKIGNSHLVLNPARHALSLIRRRRAEFIAVNAAFFGLFAATMTVTLRNPEIQPGILDMISGAAARVVSLYALVVPLLLLGAIYEAFEIIYLVRYFV